MVDFKKKLKEYEDAKAEGAKKYESEVLPDLRETSLSPKDQLSLMRLVALDVDLNADFVALKKQRDILRDQMKKLIGKKEFSAMVEGVRLRNYPTSRSSLKKEKLMDQGVSPSVIAAATVTTTSWTLKITVPGEKDEDE